MKRLSYLRRDEDRAYTAMKKDEWWNGRAWRPAGTLPRTRKEAAAYRTAQDRLAEILAAMVGGSAATRLRKAKNFSQSANALRKRDARKEDSADAWTTLVARFGEERLREPTTKALIVECVEELRRGRHVTRKGAPWTYEGVKSLLRRRKKL